MDIFVKKKKEKKNQDVKGTIVFTQNPFCDSLDFSPARTCSKVWVAIWMTTWDSFVTTKRHIGPTKVMQ